MNLDNEWNIGNRWKGKDAEVITEDQAEAIAGSKSELRRMGTSATRRSLAANEGNIKLGYLFNEAELVLRSDTYRIVGTAAQIAAVKKRLEAGEQRLMKWHTLAQTGGPLREFRPTVQPQYTKWDHTHYKGYRWRRR